MNKYMVVYDVGDTCRKSIAEALREEPNWWSIMDNAWVVVTNKTAQELFNRLERFIDKEKKFIVVSINSDSIAGWLKQDEWDWLKTI